MPLDLFRSPIEGEHYAGVMLGLDGGMPYHLYLLPGDVYQIDWHHAAKWATSANGELPNRRELYLLYANLKEQFVDHVYWSSDNFAGQPDYAWGHSFNGGEQGYYHKHGKLRARAVRRVYVTYGSNMSVMMLANSTKFASPLFTLMHQLTVEGRDVSTELEEANALREGIKIADEALEEISVMAIKARSWNQNA